MKRIAKNARILPRYIAMHIFARAGGQAGRCKALFFGHLERIGQPHGGVKKIFIDMDKVFESKFGGGLTATLDCQNHPIREPGSIRGLTPPLAGWNGVLEFAKKWPAGACQCQLVCIQLYMIAAPL